MQMMGFRIREGLPEFWMAVDLLNYRGHFQHINPFAVTGLWEDDKVIIEGLVDLKSQEISNIRIGLKMTFKFEDEPLELLKPFPPSLEPEDKRSRYTIVYDGEKFPQYFRP